MFLSTPSVSPDALADIGKVAAEDLAAIALAVNGKFDARIKELKDLKAGIDAANTIAKTVAAATKLEATSASKLDVVIQREANAEVLEDMLLERERDLIKQANSIALREGAAASREEFIAASISKMEADTITTQNRLDYAQNELNLAVAKLAHDCAEFEQAKAEFNAKLAALKA